MSQLSLLQSQIQSAVKALARHPGDWVSLADVRDRLPGNASRADVDAALKSLERSPNVHITPENDQTLLTGRDRTAALKFGGVPNHRISIRRG